MGVHVNSVISTTVQTHDSALYTAITNMEEYCFDSGTNAGQTEYSPIFTDLNTALLAYFNRDDVDPNNSLVTRKEKLQFVIQGLYGYKTFFDMYSTSGAQLTASDAFTVLGMNGVRARLKTDGVSYYDDYPTVTFSTGGTDTITRSAGSFVTDGFTEGSTITITGSTSNNTTYTISTGGVAAGALTVDETVTSETGSSNVIITQTGARMGGTKVYADIAAFNTVAEIDAEHSRMDTLLAAYRDTIGAQQFKLLFEDVTPGVTLDKEGMNTYMLDTLHWRGIVTSVLGLTAPPVP